MCNSLPSLYSDVYYVTLYKAMFLLAFYAFLRVGEYTVASCSDHVLSVDQVQIVAETPGSVQHLLVKFKSFKHSQGRPFNLEIFPVTPSSTCPVHAMKHYLRFRPSHPGPLFIFPDKTPVSSRHFGSILQQVLVQVNGSSLGFSPHSFRIGSVTHAFYAKNLSKEVICRMARWSSSTAIDSYIRVQSFVN